MKQLKNFLIKREQRQACLSFAKREKSRLLAKTLLTLVALLAVTTGAWADGVTMKEITNSDIQSSWNGNTDPVKATDLPGFKAMTHDEAVALGAPSNNEKVYLIYAINASNRFAALIYESGTKSSNETEFNLNELQSTAQNYWVYYTYSDAPEPSSGPEVAWDKAKKTGTFNMPGGNVTLEPEYYPQAALAAAPTAINDVPATTDGAIVNAGTVANIGETTKAQGTVMYYVSPTALDDAALLALAADQWTADVPTAQSLAQGPAYVYYYVRGNDSDNDEENFSDGDILAANALTVTIAAEPLWNAEFDLTNAPEEDKAGKWSTDIPEGGVVKGTEVKVTYTGTKKVIGVKVEKSDGSKRLDESTVGMIVCTNGKAYPVNMKDNLPSGVTAVGIVAYKNGKNGLVMALTDEATNMNWGTATGNNGAKAHTPAVEGYSWKLPTLSEWQYNIFTGAGVGNLAGLSTYMTAAGGTGLQNGCYWTSTPKNNSYYACCIKIENGSIIFSPGGNTELKSNVYCVRACLAF